MKLLAVVALTACEHKELCIHQPAGDDGETHIIVAQYDRRWEIPEQHRPEQWQEWDNTFTFPYDSLMPAVPAGLRALIYHADGTHDTRNLSAYGGSFHVASGHHTLLFYNNDTEAIVLRDLDQPALASATTRDAARAANANTGDNTERTATQPDMLYGTCLRSYNPDSDPHVLDITMRPLVHTYAIRINFTRGAQYATLARGTLTGMAAGVRLATGTNLTETAAIAFDATLTRGGVQATVRSFGLPEATVPDYATRAGGNNTLHLEVAMTNGYMKPFDFDITSQIALQPLGGVIVIDGAEITDDDINRPKSAFEVDVNQWRPRQDILLPF